MAIIRPASDLQRNINSIYELCSSTKEPVYITRNGEASLVVMDVQAFEERMGLTQAIYEREMRIYEAIMRSEEEIKAGLVYDFEDIRRMPGAEA